MSECKPIDGAPKLLPTIYGDGVHDDAAGLQAAINGDEFEALNDCVKVIDSKLRFGAGVYLVSKTLQLRDPRISK